MIKRQEAKIACIGIVFMLISIPITLFADEWFGGLLFGASFIYMLNAEKFAKQDALQEVHGK